MVRRREPRPHREGRRVCVEGDLALDRAADHELPTAPRLRSEEGMVLFPRHPIIEDLSMQRALLYWAIDTLPLQKLS